MLGETFGFNLMMFCSDFANAFKTNNCGGVVAETHSNCTKGSCTCEACVHDTIDVHIWWKIYSIQFGTVALAALPVEHCVDDIRQHKF